MRCENNLHNVKVKCIFKGFKAGKETDATAVNKKNHVVARTGLEKKIFSIVNVYLLNLEHRSTKENVMTNTCLVPASYQLS